MKALITGISGFTGKHLAERLKRDQIEVMGIDRQDSAYFTANLTDKSKVKAILKQVEPDWLFHLASPLLRGDQLIDANLTANLQTDLIGTANLLEAVGELKVKPRVLVTGTNAQYLIEDKKIAEDQAMLPVTSYGLSKLTQELVAKQLADSYGVELVYTRTFHLLGPKQKLGFVINDLCQQVALMERGEKEASLEVGNITNRRDFTDVRDATEAYIAIMSGGKNGESYNVCSGESHAIAEVVDWLQSATDNKFKVKVLEEKKRNNDPEEIVGDNAKLRGLGWKQNYDFKQSLQDTLDYWRSVVRAL